MALTSESFIIPVDQRGDRPRLFVAVKRYTHSASPQPCRGGVALVLTHGVTFHKELWEPTLSQLFDLQSHFRSPVRIHEAWVIDAPNHGESARLNDSVLSSGHYITFRDYARAVTAFLASGLLDLSTSCLVAVGHSAGAAPLVWATDEWHRRTGVFPFQSLIMLEPSLISIALDVKYDNFNASLADKARRRRSCWSSRKEASRWFQKQRRHWDPRCSALFEDYGLRPMPSASREVTLSCSGEQEAACYNVPEQDEVLGILERLCPLFSVHAIFAEYVDLFPHREIQDNIIDESQGRSMASVTWMPGVGHFAPFEKPDLSGRAVFHCLCLALRDYVSTTPHGRVAFTEARL